MNATNKVEMNLADKMDELLEEARNLGYCFSFETVKRINGRYETVIVYSDEDDFGFDIMKGE